MLWQVCSRHYIVLVIYNNIILFLNTINKLFMMKKIRRPWGRIFILFSRMLDGDFFQKTVGHTGVVIFEYCIKNGLWKDCDICLAEVTEEDISYKLGYKRNFRLLQTNVFFEVGAVVLMTWWFNHHCLLVNKILISLADSFMCATVISEDVPFSYLI